MAKKRIPIPTGTLVDVESESDRTCCVCKRPNQDYQIHHLDGNPANNQKKNLVLLCLGHHSEAEKKGGAGRRLTSDLLVRYRSQWNASVLQKNLVARVGANESNASSSHDELTTQITALAIHDIRNLHRKLFGCLHEKWKGAEGLILEIGAFVSGATEEKDQRVHLEAALALEHIASYARHKMPVEVGSAIHTVAYSLFPFPLTLLNATQPLSLVQSKLLDNVLSIGFVLAYDGALYLNNFKVVHQGADLLWMALRYARVGGHGELQKRITKEVDRLIFDQRLGPANDAVRWLKYLKQDALDNPTEPYLLKPPDDLFGKT